MKIDYQFKSKVLDSIFFKKFISAQRVLSRVHFYGSSEDFDDINKYLENLNDEKLRLDYIRAYRFLYGGVVDDKFVPGLKQLHLREFIECQRIYNSYRARVIRLRHRISNILNNGDCLFLTLTFNNDSLEKLSSKTRREYVQKFLSSLDCFDYVANIDFGKKNGREHYHAVVGISHVDYHLWKYGAINGIKIRNNTDDISRVSRYISKLVNHAIKETTKRCAILYKRLKY